MRILGVDLGIKRTGLAVSDELGMTTRALPTLVPKSRAEDVSTLVALCASLEVKAVAIGLPLLPQSGDDGPMARRARGFAEALSVALRDAGSAVTVHLVDERGTSREATARLVSSGIKKSARRALTDGEAARILVEDLLRARRNTP